MTIDFTGLRHAWTAISAYVGSMGWQNWLFWLSTALIIGAALYQMVGHSSRRFWQITGAVVLAATVGFGIFSALEKAVPRFSDLTVRGTDIVATLTASVLSFAILLVLTRRIPHPGSSATRHKRKANKDNLVTQMGHFGKTAAGPSDSNWASNRAIRDEMLDSYRPNGLNPTKNEFEIEFMRRCQLRDQPQHR